MQSDELDSVLPDDRQKGYWQRARLADEVGFDTMPDAAGGEVVTGSLNRKG